MNKQDVAPDAPSHTEGASKGEEKSGEEVMEGGRDDARAGRTARDSTSINAEAEEPIDPQMPHLPPA